MEEFRAEVGKEFEFEASHVLPHHKGKCSNLHGHSWKLSVMVEQEVDQQTGMVMDYADIKEIVQPIVNELDHAHLGAWETDKVHILQKGTKFPNIVPFPFDNPTSENILLAIGIALYKKGLRFSRIMLEETKGTVCVMNLDAVVLALEGSSQGWLQLSE